MKKKFEKNSLHKWEKSLFFQNLCTSKINTFGRLSGRYVIQEFGMLVYNLNNSTRKFLMHRTNTWNFSVKQNLSKLCFVPYCKNMHWYNCVKDCYIHDMKIHKKRAISIYPTIVLQQIIDLFSQVYNFGTFFSDIVA